MIERKGRDLRGFEGDFAHFPGGPQGKCAKRISGLAVSGELLYGYEFSKNFDFAQRPDFGTTKTLNQQAEEPIIENHSGI